MDTALCIFRLIPKQTASKMEKVTHADDFLLQ